MLPPLTHTGPTAPHHAREGPGRRPRSLGPGAVSMVVCQPACSSRLGAPGELRAQPRQGATRGQGTSALRLCKSEPGRARGPRGIYRKACNPQRQSSQERGGGHAGEGLGRPPPGLPAPAGEHPEVLSQARCRPCALHGRGAMCPCRFLAPLVTRGSCGSPLRGLRHPLIEPSLVSGGSSR